MQWSDTLCETKLIGSPLGEGNNLVHSYYQVIHLGSLPYFMVTYLKQSLPFLVSLIYLFTKWFKTIDTSHIFR